MSEQPRGAYGADDDIVDYILGITYEIWEGGGIELIHQYYAADSVIYGLDGITHGAQAVVDGTRATLRGFPDRLLLGEDIIWSGNREDGFYSSHRLLSVGTNVGPTVFGPPTGTRIQMMNIADCVVEEGVITKEWLVRDNMTLATQLGADPIVEARKMADARSEELNDWIESEIERVRKAEVPDVNEPVSPRDDPESFAWRVLHSCWTGDREMFETTHAPYTAMHRSPLSHFSGRGEVHDYYQNLRRIMGHVHFSVDHIASQPFGENGTDVAVRWTATGLHEGEVMGVRPTGKPMFILGITHWRCVNDHIAVEKTIFDDLAVLSQTMIE
jgi:predicted ester cyclase